VIACGEERSGFFDYTSVNGSVCGQPWQQQQALGRKGDFAVHANMYVKVQAGLTPASDCQEKKKKKKKKKKEACSVPELGCLATYMGYVSRVSICLC
jgi:hypothetical protein